EDDDDRQHRAAGVPAELPLPGGRGLVLHPDGDPAHRDRRLCTDPRDPEHPGVRVSTEVTAGGRRKRWTRFLLPTYAGLVMLYLVTPILVMILYGFNNSGPKRVSFRWSGFTLEWYKRLFDKPDLTAALKNSLFIATVSTL